MTPERRAPFPPGTSPFHVKGIVYLGTHEFFEKHVSGGIASLHREIRDDAVRAFIQQKFLPASWYDALPVAPLIEAEARAMAMSLPKYLRVRTQFQADRDIAGVYRFLMKLVSPETVGLRLPRLIQQMCDFGSIQTTVVSPGHILLEISGWPLMLKRWCETAFQTYSEVALRAAGAKSSHIDVLAPERDGDKQGIELTKLRIDIRWVER